MNQRKLKELHFLHFIKALNDVAINNSDDKAQLSLSESFNHLILIANSKVVNKLMEFHNFVRSENQIVSRSSTEWSIKHDDLLTELIKTMREDLFGKSVNNDFKQIHLIGRKTNKNQ